MGTCKVYITVPVVSTKQRKCYASVLIYVTGNVTCFVVGHVHFMCVIIMALEVDIIKT